MNGESAQRLRQPFLKWPYTNHATYTSKVYWFEFHFDTKPQQIGRRDEGQLQSSVYQEMQD